MKIKRNIGNLLVIIVVIALVAAGVYYFYGDEMIEDWPPGTVDGSWRKNVYLITEDGSKELITRDGLKLVSGEDTVTAIQVVLEARATTPAGSDPYNNVEIDRSGTAITAAFGVDGGTTYWSSSSDFSGTITNAVDGVWFTVYSTTFDLEAAESSATNLPWTGGDTLWLNFAGDIDYRGTTATYEGSWVTIPGPTLPTLGLTYIGYGLNLEWQDNIDWTPEETITCWQCDGYTAVSSGFSGTTCPSGWQETVPDCGTPPTGVTLEIDDTTIGVGSQGTVDVTVFNVDDLDSGEIYIQYDSNVLIYVRGTAGGSGYVSNSDDGTTGTVRLMPQFSSPQTGDIVLGTITFERISAGSEILEFDQEESYLLDSTDTNIPIESWVTGIVS